MVLIKALIRIDLIQDILECQQVRWDEVDEIFLPFWLGFLIEFVYFVDSIFSMDC